jgi:hypothetical protein
VVRRYHCAFQTSSVCPVSIPGLYSGSSLPPEVLIAATRTLFIHSTELGNPSREKSS